MAKTGEKPTFKQKLFVKKYIELKGNGTRAALAAYDTRSPIHAQTIATVNLNKPVIQQELANALRKAGLTEDDFAEKLQETYNLSVGKQPKNSDAVALLNLMAKVFINNGVKKSMHMSYNMNMKNSDILELKTSLEELNKKTQQLIEDLKS